MVSRAVKVKGCPSRKVVAPGWSAWSLTCPLLLCWPPDPAHHRYVGKEVVKRAIPMEQACDELIQLIKDNGRWVDPPKEEDAAGGEGGAKQLVAA